MKVEYQPKTNEERNAALEITIDDYHNGDTGPGTSVPKTGNDMTSNNCHVINVFAKKLQIMKVDQSENIITENDEATFKLYRKVTAAEVAEGSAEIEEVPGLDGSYVSVQTLNTSDGVVTMAKLPLLADNEPYYLVETKAPSGYSRLIEPLKAAIDMNEHNTWTVLSDLTTSQIKPNPYVLSNWLQEATIKVTAPDDKADSFAVRVVSENEHGFSYDHTNDTTVVSVTYKIINNAGYELPATGGPGTNLIYLFGIMLTGFAGAGLVMKKRRKAA